MKYVLRIIGCVKCDNNRRNVMLFTKVVKLVIQRRAQNQPVYVTAARAKMDLTIARLQQNSQVHLLRTDYLE